MPADEAEDETERARRRYQRGLFDGAARLYQATRPGYPPELAGFVAETAGVGAGDPVLEVGCGTGQLTEVLLPFRFALTAIDLGAAMIEVARERIGGNSVSFRAVAFEQLDAAPETFTLIIAGAAFHWIDPEVRFAKAARLLRPGGWLAVAGYHEQYDEPFESALEAMWQARADREAWAPRPADGAAIRDSGLFGPLAERTFAHRIVRRAQDVVGVENTRGIYLSWPDDVRQAFNEELRERLGDQPEVGVTVAASVIMAPVLAAAAGA